MPHRSTMYRFSGISCITGILALALAGCGGGGGGGSAGGTAPSAVSLGGVAAVGAPIVNGTVKVVCSNGGAVTTTTTSSTGAWSINLSGQTLPCAVELTGGTINGAANPTAYHSLAIAAGTVNISPLTDLMVANLAGSATPSTWFTGLNTTPTPLAAITQTQVNTALTKLSTALSGLSQLSTTNPITTPFTPTLMGNASDNMLTTLAMAMPKTGVTYSTLLSNAAAGFPTPSAAFNTALQQSYTSLATGAIIFSPNDLYVFPESLGTILNPGISGVQVGQSFSSGSISNCSGYGAIVAKQGGTPTATEALTTWAVTDTVIGYVMSQPTSTLGPMLKIQNYGMTSVSIFSPAMNITGYFNIHSVIPSLFPSATTFAPNQLSAGKIILGVSPIIGMDLLPWTITSDTPAVANVSSAALGACGELTVSTGSSGYANIKAVSNGPAGAVTLGPVKVCVDNVTKTFCNSVSNVGGTVSGLPAGSSVVLQDNATDSVMISNNGAFKFAQKVASGSPYSVTVLTQPIGATCSVSNGSGTVSTQDITNIAVNCVPTPSNPFSGTSWSGTYNIASTAGPASASGSCNWAGTVDNSGSLVLSQYSCTLPQGPVALPTPNFTPGGTAMVINPNGSLQNVLNGAVATMSSLGYSCTTNGGSATLSPKSINYSFSCGLAGANLTVSATWSGN